MLINSVRIRRDPLEDDFVPTPTRVEVLAILAL